MDRNMNRKMNRNKIENLHPQFNEEGHVTTHDFFYTPNKFPMSGAITYICHGMPEIFLKSPAYKLQALRSLWMAEKGVLQLVIGEVWRSPLKANLWTFANNCVIVKSLKGALKIDNRHFIRFQTMVQPEVFKGSVKIELDGEVVLSYIVDNSQNSQRKV